MYLLKFLCEFIKGYLSMELMFGGIDNDSHYICVWMLNQANWSKHANGSSYMNQMLKIWLVVEYFIQIFIWLLML